jgi:hypothetical protein
MQFLRKFTIPRQALRGLIRWAINSTTHNSTYNLRRFYRHETTGYFLPKSALVPLEIIFAL